MNCLTHILTNDKTKEAQRAKREVVWALIAVIAAAAVFIGVAGMLSTNVDMVGAGIILLGFAALTTFLLVDQLTAAIRNAGTFQVSILSLLLAPWRSFLSTTVVVDAPPPRFFLA